MYPNFIEHCLVLSTGTLTEEVCVNYLRTCPWACYEKGDYGWFVYVPDDMPDDVPQCLIDTIAKARSFNCQWIMFDRDALETLDLPIYDW